MILPLLLLLAAQDAPAAPAQDGPFKHGIWSGQCWRREFHAGEGGICRASGGEAGKLWIMLERHAARLDIYASGSCGDDTGVVTVPQAQLVGADRVRVVSAAIAAAAGRVNQACKTEAVFAGRAEDLAALLSETDGLDAGAAK